MFYLMRDISTLTGVPFPELGVPLYGEREGELLVPTDEEIIEWVQAAREPHRYYFGIMATFGTRPHEIDSSTLLSDDNLQITSATKTGQRIIIPLYPEWIDLFGLREKQFRPETGRVVPVPDECSQWLNKERVRLGIKWRAYALRHAYCARLWRMGGGQLDVYTAARLMGHSVKEHERTYRSHIQPFTIASAAKDAINRNLRAVSVETATALQSLKPQA
jgi:integrase